MRSPSRNTGWTILRWILTRAMPFYLLLYFLSGWIVDHEVVDFGVKVRVIERAMPPSFEPLAHHLRGGSLPDDGWDGYIHFYRTVLRYFPERADAWNMLGYIYAYQGNTTLSRQAWEKAWSEQPDHFWFAYNLAVHSWRRDDWQSAADYFVHALGTDPQEAFEYINRSQIIYLSVLMTDPILDRGKMERLTRGYYHAYVLLIDSLWRLQRYKAVESWVLQAIEKGFDRRGEMHLYAGMALLQQGRKEDARPYLDTARRRGMTAPWLDSFLPSGSLTENLPAGLVTSEEKKAMGLRLHVPF